MIEEKRGEIIKKALSSVSEAIKYAQELICSLPDNRGPAGGAQGAAESGGSALPAGSGGEGGEVAEGSLRRAYASALRCRLEIQYALLLIQKGLSIKIGADDPAALPSRSLQKPRLVAGLKSDLEGALLALESESLESAAERLASSDAEVARLISKIRGEIKQSARALRQGRDRLPLDQE